MASQRNLDMAREMMQRAMEMQVATKILDGIAKLDDDFVNTNRRWPWELLQNAHDASLGSSLEIELEMTDTELIFRHNGRPFLLKNLTFLINQTSSKERAERNEDGVNNLETVGKYGTGFMTTHLLSKVIRMHGVFERPDLKTFQSFSVVLDRSAKTPEKMFEGVTQSFRVFDDLDDQMKSPYIMNYVPGKNCDTVFRYQLTDKASKEVAVRGLDDFQLSIAYVFAWIPLLKKVTIVDRVRNSNRVYQIGKGFMLGKLQVTEVNQTINGISEVILIGTVTNRSLTLARPLFRNAEGKLELRPRNHSVPTVFVDFPLIGSEKIELPFVLQSHHFDPDEKRSMIYLSKRPSATANKTILGKIAPLFQQMVEALMALDGAHLLIHLPCPQDPNVDQAWFQSTIQAPLRKMIWDLPVVINDWNQKIKPSQTFIFRRNTQKEGLELSKLLSPLFGNITPKNDSAYYSFWCSVFDPELQNSMGSRTLTFEWALTKIAEKKNLQTLAASFGNSEDSAINFLNQVYQVDSSYHSPISKYSIFPNQLGNFCLVQNLKFDLNTLEELKNVGRILKLNFEASLLHKKSVHRMQQNFDDISAATAINDCLSNNYYQQRGLFHGHNNFFSQQNVQNKNFANMDAVLALTCLMPAPSQNAEAPRQPYQLARLSAPAEVPQSPVFYEIAKMLFPIGPIQLINSKHTQIWSISNRILLDQAIAMVQSQTTLQGAQSVLRAGTSLELLNLLFNFEQSTSGKKIFPSQSGNFKLQKELKINIAEEEIAKLVGPGEKEQLTSLLFEMYQLVGGNPSETLLHSGIAKKSASIGTLEHFKLAELIDKINQYISESSNWQQEKFRTIFRHLNWIAEHTKKPTFPAFEEKKKAMFFELTPSNTKTAIVNTLTRKGGEELLTSLQNLTDDQFSQIATLVSDPKLISRLLRPDSSLVLANSSPSPGDQPKTTSPLPGDQPETTAPSGQVHVSVNRFFNYSVMENFEVDFLVNNNIANEEQLNMFAARHKIPIKRFNFSRENFEHVMRIINRSVQRVISHLINHPEYDMTGFSIAPCLNGNILRNVLLNGQPILVVVRPSDNGWFTIYADDEVAALEKPRTELWADNGQNDPRLITFGDIIRKNALLNCYFSI